MHDRFGRVGIMADGTEQFIDTVVNNVKINIQGYSDEINMHVMPLSQYDVILGVPWHEAVNAVTYHQQRMIIISQKNDDNEINKIILKQQKRDRRMQCNMNGNTSQNDSILVSAVQLKRWGQQKRKYI